MVAQKWRENELLIADLKPLHRKQSVQHRGNNKRLFCDIQAAIHSVSRTNMQQTITLSVEWKEICFTESESDCCVYQGETYLDIPHGTGIKVTKKNDQISSIEGTWKLGKEQGYMIERVQLESGENYVLSEGEWSHGKKHGHIREYGKDSKLVFEGQYLMGKKSGKGTVHSGHISCTVNFDDLHNGWGKAFKAGAQPAHCFSGFFENGVQKFGTLHFVTDQEYYGEVSSTLPHGYGVLKDEEGVKYEGIWDEGWYKEGILHEEAWHFVGQWKGKSFYNGIATEEQPNYVQQVDIEDGFIMAVLTNFRNGVVVKQSPYIKAVSVGLINYGNFLLVGPCVCSEQRLATQKFFASKFDSTVSLKPDTVMYAETQEGRQYIWTNNTEQKVRRYLGDLGSAETKTFLKPFLKHLSLLERSTFKKKAKNWTGRDLIRLDSLQLMQQAQVPAKIHLKLLQLIAQDKQQMQELKSVLEEFPEVLHRLWETRRVLWIAATKESYPGCAMALLSRDVLRYIIKKYLNRSELQFYTEVDQQAMMVD